jgi:hypothetical protein
MATFQGLDQLDAMQRAPLGTYSALRRPSPTASQYKRQASLYGQALRTLTRAARRGDANAALKAIDVGNDAMSRGFSPGGIRDAEGFKAEAGQFEADMAQGAADMGQKERLDRRFAGSTLSREPVNPNATPGAGYGTPVKGSREDWIEGDRTLGSTTTATPLTEEQKRRKLTLDGAFGSGARDNLLRREQRRSVLDRATTLPVDTYLA